MELAIHQLVRVVQVVLVAADFGIKAQVVPAILHLHHLHKAMVVEMEPQVLHTMVLAPAVEQVLLVLMEQTVQVAVLVVLVFYLVLAGLQHTMQVEAAVAVMLVVLVATEVGVPLDKVPMVLRELQIPEEVEVELAAH